MNIDCDIKPITNITNTKCLGTVSDNILWWKSHIDKIIPKLNTAYVEIKCQLDATEVFIADLIACSTC